VVGREHDVPGGGRVDGNAERLSDREIANHSVEPTKTLRVGCVKYLNARPLIHGWPGDVVLDNPAALCVQLVRGELDLALVSSFEFLRNPIYRIVDDVSISSVGPVYSVIIAHQGEMAEVEEIELDPASETSVALLRCLLAQCGLNPRLVTKDQLEKRLQRKVLGSTGCQPAVAGSLPTTPGDIPRTGELIAAPRQAAETDRLATGRVRPTGGLAACAPQTSPSSDAAQLLIGDQAIRFRQEHANEFQYWDLGEQWKKLVDLPFVYALWLIRPEVVDPKTIASRLRALRDENLAKIDNLIAEEKEFDREFCARYYREHLRFNFGEKEKEGLRKFQRLCEMHGLLPKRKIAFTVV
jgi:predicted solute-binding protein